MAGAADSSGGVTVEELARQFASFKSDAVIQIARLRERVAELEDDWDVAGDIRPRRTGIRCRRQR